MAWSAALRGAPVASRGRDVRTGPRSVNAPYSPI